MRQTKKKKKENSQKIAKDKELRRCGGGGKDKENKRVRLLAQH